MKKYEIAYFDLKSKIISGEINSLIPSETKIMGAYEIGRGSARQAIRRLIDEGYCISKHGKGTFVIKTNVVNHKGFHHELVDYQVKKVSYVISQKTMTKMNEMILNFAYETFLDEVQTGFAIGYLKIDHELTIEKQMKNFIDNLNNNNQADLSHNDHYKIVSFPIGIETDLMHPGELVVLKTRTTYDKTAKLSEFSETYIKLEHFELFTTNN